MRILLLATHFAPELTGNAPLLGELCADLAARGHQTHVLAGPAEQNVLDLPPWHRRLGICREHIEGIPVVRVNGLPLGPAWPRRLMMLVWFPLVAFWVGLLMPSCDVILCPSPPMWLGLAAHLLGRIRRVPYVYVVQDLWPDAPIRLGLVRSRLMLWLLRRIEQLVYRGASRIVVITAIMERRLVELGVRAEKIDQIPNWVDLSFFATPAGPCPRRWREGLSIRPEDVLVLYSGNMGRSHPVQVVVEAASRLTYRPEIRFVLVGAGAALEPARAAARRARLDNVCFLPFQPRATLPAMLASADIAVVTQLAGMGAFSLPSRIYMFLAAGLPLVGSLDRDSGAAELLAEAGCGIRVDPDDPAALADAIARLASDQELRRQLGESGRRYAACYCGRQGATRRYEETLLRALGVGRPGSARRDRKCEPCR